MKPLRQRIADACGYTITDILVTCALFGVTAAIAVPQLTTGLDSMRLGMALRDVERELQFARLKAVSANQAMRIRFNCPAATQLRVVEVIGTAANPDVNDLDGAAARCDETRYPYKPTGGDSNRLTRPNNDGPIRRLPAGATFTASQTLEFWPDGSVHTACQALCNPGAATQIATVTITISRKGKTKNITVNGLGKILLDR